MNSHPLLSNQFIHSHPLLIEIMGHIYTRIEEEEFGEGVEYSDYLFEVIDHEVDIMFDSKVERMLCEYGFDNALKCFDDDYGLDSLPKDNFSKCILCCVIKTEYQNYAL